MCNVQLRTFKYSVSATLHTYSLCKPPSVSFILSAQELNDVIPRADRSLKTDEVSFSVCTNTIELSNYCKSPPPSKRISFTSPPPFEEEGAPLNEFSTFPLIPGAP